MTDDDEHRPAREVTPQDDPGRGRDEAADRGPHDGPEGGSGGVDRWRRLVAAERARRKLSTGPVRPLAERLAEVTGAVARSGAEWPDFYGDGVVTELEERTAELLGMPAAVWFPTGTMAQQAALRCWAARTGNPRVALHPGAHPVQHERDALERLSGLQPVRIGAARAPVTAEDVYGLDEPVGTVMLELPLVAAGYALPTWEELNRTVAAAREREAVVHVDGARLWESTTWFGRPLAEIAALADSVYVSFYKSLRGLSGAALAGPEDLVEEARAWRHRYGGNLVQQWPAVLTALAGLDRELPRLPSYVTRARLVAAELRAAFDAAELPFAVVHPEEPHTHQFEVWLAGDPDALTLAAVRQAEETGTALFGLWWAAGPPGLAATDVTVEAPGLDWTAEDVREAARTFLAYAGRARA
ncbi:MULTISPECIES: threonine aldolase family protein [unclassified Streptomyces]|uniref:threonine aldolase family protein n=1 Tax=unclassified Streptomyces TaxID=2593676 RepID=UPI0022B687A1|nr:MULTISPECIES: beta-eliminating lyase-related protein [unclassified Streptomyces]MCZ7415065.1 beta-eliminating lyase-related protein [Streptomyces sp. WMMC897]MCZ7432008.1 beta-eliminating lyase-related protein [Streptomyces sp. WMMC1477]